MKTPLAFALLGILAAAGLPPLASAATWNLSEEYPGSQINPNGGWRYGWWDGGLSVFTLYNSFTKSPAGETRIDNFHHNGDLDSWGSVGYGDGGETFTREDWPHGMHFMAHKTSLMSATVESFDRIASAGFTAPAAGKYEITVTFKNNSADGDISRTLVFIHRGEVAEIVDEGEVYGFGDEPEAPESFHRYAGTFTLAAGDGVYFGNAAHENAADPRWHHVGVDAVIKAEMPAGMLQLASVAYSTAEGNSGVTPLSVTVERTEGSGGAVSVEYSTADGTAIAGEDYTASSGTLTWADGDTAAKTFTVEVLGDAAFEPTETFEITLSNPGGGAGLGQRAAAEVTISNDDLIHSGPVWSLNQDFPNHYSNPHSPWVFGFWDGALDVFTLYNSFTNVPAEETRIDNFHHNGDLDSWGNVGYGDGGETFTREDWPHGMHFMANMTSLMSATAEFFDRTTSAGFVAPEAGEYQVSATFKNNTADGDISKTLVFTRIGGKTDIVDEAEIHGFGDENTAPESFHRFARTFTLAAGDGVYFAHPAHEAASDPRWHHVGLEAVVKTAVPVGVVRFASMKHSVAEGQGGTTPVTISVERVEGSEGAVSVNYSTSDGTATAGEDYTAASGTLTWANGETGAKSFTLEIRGDSVWEANETVLFALSQPAGGLSVGVPSAGEVIILNDDLIHPGPVWSLNQDFPDHYSNPHSPWIFGFWNEGFSNFTLYNSFAKEPAGEARIDNFHHNGHLDSHGNVGYGDGGETFTRDDWPHGMHFMANMVTLMTPDQSLESRLTSAGFIIPQAGNYQVSATFKNNNADGDISRVAILVRRGEVAEIVDEADIQGFGDDKTTAPESFHTSSGTFTLAAGDGIYFVQLAHPEAMDPRYHHVGLDAAISAVDSSPAPGISIAPAAEGISITFEGVLQVNSNGGLGVWEDVPGAVSPYQAPVSGVSRFWRARSAK